MMSFFAKSDMTGLRNLWLLFGGVHFCKFANRDCRIEAIVSQMENWCRKWKLKKI